MALRIVAFTLLKIAFGSILLDDMDKSLTAHSLNMEEGGLEDCRAEAHAGSFHHDGARNKASASFAFKFEVSQDGCYSLEEYHPGFADNNKCSQLLTTNAQLDLGWCKGQKSTITLDQSKDGGLWNFVGIFPFYVGHPGALKMSNPAGSEGKHLMVDAFRITRVADKCNAPLQRQLWRESEARKQEARTAAKSSTSTTIGVKTTSTTIGVKTTGAQSVGVKATSALASALRWQEGALQLSVQSNPASGDVDLHASLKAHTSTLAVTLKTHLQARSVVVKDILPLDSRRLGGCRRLEAVGNSVDFVVHFKAEVAASQAVREAALASELSTALADAGAKFTVASTELQWQPLDATSRDPASAEAASNTGSSRLPLILAGCAGVLVVAVTVAGWLMIRSRRVAPAEAKDHQKELEEQNENRQDEGKAADENKGELDDTASTATPTSDCTPNDTEVDLEVLSIDPVETV